MRARLVANAGVMVLTAFTPGFARKGSGGWMVLRQTDPITGKTSCVVAALDGDGSFGFSRTGYLYPVVENNPDHGLLIGVSSGGRFRLPTGDILWRVDERPHRELKAADNPPTSTSAAMMPTGPTGDDAASKSMRDVLAMTAKLTNGMTATSTVASGEKAKEMLVEMLAGHALIFRSAAAAPDYGLQSSAATRVGQVTSKGLRPIPIDDSFRSGLAACGISEPISAR